MELVVLKNESDEVELVLKKNRHTFPNLVRSRLLDDPSVSFVAYKLNHPLDDDSQLIVKTKKGSAKKALQEAAKKIGEDLADFRKAVEKLK